MGIEGHESFWELQSISKYLCAEARAFRSELLNVTQNVSQLPALPSAETVSSGAAGTPRMCLSLPQVEVQWECLSLPQVRVQWESQSVLFQVRVAGMSAFCLCWGAVGMSVPSPSWVQRNVCLFFPRSEYSRNI